MTLAREKCVACRRDSPRVTPEEIDELHPVVSDWELTEVDEIKRLDRTFKFSDFAGALEFSQKVGEIAEDEGHHPRIITEWGACQRRLVDAQDTGPPPQRLHHGREDRRAVWVGGGFWVLDSRLRRALHNLPLGLSFRV